MDHDIFPPFIGSRYIRGAIFGVLFFLALFLAMETIQVFQNLGRLGVPASDTVSVTGNGQATVVPDIARVSFTVEHTAKTVAGAQAATTKQANAVLAFVKQQGIADKDVKTTAYTISPQYSYTTCLTGVVCPIGNRTLTGYRVAESVQVTLRDLTKVGAFLSGLGKLQVQSVSGPDFTLDDPTAGYDAARADAIAEAKAQAALLAKQLGVRLDKIVHFSESSNGSVTPLYAKGIGGAVETTPSVPVGENTYTATVIITYEIR